MTNMANSTQNDTNKTEASHKKNKDKRDPPPPVLNQTQNHHPKNTTNNHTNINKVISTSQKNNTQTNKTQEKSHQEVKGALQEPKDMKKIESKAANKWLLIGPIIVVVLGLIFFLRLFIKRMWHSMKITQKGYAIGQDQEQESVSA